jgi:beta-glucanase (GH16 family)
MKAPRSRPTRLALACAAVLAVVLIGCGNSTPSQLAKDAAIAAGGSGGTGGTSTGAGGTTAGTGGQTSGTGGQSPGTGGAATGSGGTASGTGGRTSGAGGVTGGTGGRTSGTGGRSASTTGSAIDGGQADTGTPRPDGSAGRDGAAEAPAGRDSALDAGPAPSDVALADSSAGDGGIPVPPGYKLLWSDEFDVDGTPNAKNWNYEKGFARNEELQWYQPDNAQVKGGVLVIEGRKERVANPNYQAGSSDWKTSRQYAEYTSTSMTTSGLQSWQYGRFELRARIPTSAGMWPAWWTLGVSGEWPSNGEIDIMEYYNKNNSSSGGNVLANVACGTSTRWQAKWDSSTKSLSSLGGATWSSSFHVWRMDWDDQKIDLYLDDTLMNSVPLASMLNADGSSPFKQKHYMLVNLAIGGTNGGDPSGTAFPQRYEVDWIRVYQKL